MSLATVPPPTQEEQDILDGLFTFIERRVMPLQESLADYFADSRRYFDETGNEAHAVVEARRRVRLESAEAGYYNLFTPEEFGGAGLSKRLYMRVTEEVSRRYGPGMHREHLATEAVPNVFMGPGPIWTRASAELRDEIVPRLLRGEIRGAFGLSEPDAGTDNFNMKTTARREGDEWVINGTKQWTSWAAESDYLLVFAVTDPERAKTRSGGVTCFYVPTDSPGYRLVSNIHLFGDPGGRDGIEAFDEVRVPDAWRIGPEGEGMKMAFLTLNTSRLWLAVRLLGEAFWAFDRSVEYANTRRTFGKTIGEHQSIQNMLADMAVDLYSTHTMAFDCAARFDAGQDIRVEGAIVKYAAANACGRVFDNAMQLHGGMGFSNETYLFDGWKHARMARVTEGSDQMMQRTIARRTLVGGLPNWCR
ncbi:acyl-CoA dehydrogenase family protein [Pseudonocardia pini]|uniref:acyl-CoA dehydrogenase family protein n=1 Tax=Pseudonocardia pini TaxID=2758030 RepID=UPI0015F0A65D|nr:acyl-CoA dehydrogenase family protein [Pseudonocardia pini]